MAKVQLLAILSLDGCLSEKSGDARWWLHPERYEIEDFRHKADSVLDEETSLSTLTAWSQWKDDAVYLIEASLETAEVVNGMLRMHLIDEIILYTVPFIAGNGSQLFESALPTSYWKPIGNREYNGGIIRTIYHRKQLME